MSPAKNPKTSARYSNRPPEFADSLDTWHRGIEWYFDKHEKYKIASKQCRSGKLDVVFPEGMYRPPPVTCER